MSIRLPECNAQMSGTGTPVKLNLPSGASFKAANVGFVTGIFVRTPVSGYENAVTYNILSRGQGGTGGNDGYLQFNQAGTVLTANFRSSGTNLLASTTVTGIPQGSTLLVMFIATATNVHIVVCKPGSAPLITTVANTTCYSTNLSASDVWAIIGGGTGASTYSHYGPVEEAFHLHGLFPESAGVPDTTLIQNIATGAQDIATLDTLLTGTVAKKWRYRMRLQDDLADAFGVAGALTAVNTNADKVILSGGPLRPVALSPDMVLSSPSQVRFGIAGNAATAAADIRVEGGTYTGIMPSAIQARLRKEDGTVHVNWSVIDAAPGNGVWQAGILPAVPMIAGDLTCDIRAVDGVGAQIGDIIASHGLKGTGGFSIACSQSQGVFNYYTGAGMAIPSNMRARFTYYDDGAGKWRTKALSSLNSNSRLARGMRQAAIEWNTLFPGVPIHFATVGIQGQAIQNFFGGGAWAFMWSSLKQLLGVVQPYVLYPMGHSASADATYETKLGSLIAKAIADLGQPLFTIHAEVPRYAGAGTSGSYTQVSSSRKGTRNRVANNLTTDYLAAHPQVVKCDTGDTGPHPADTNVGQGRTGALLAWGLMMWARAVEDEPMTIIGALKVNGGTEVELVLGRANA